MINFKELEDNIPNYQRAILKPFKAEGKIEIFSDKTENLARFVYEQFCRYDERKDIAIPGTFEDMREPIKWYLEQGALIGAFAASRAIEGHNVYDIGGAIGIASTTYALFSGRPITLVDMDTIETTEAKKISKLMGVDHLVSIVNSKAEEIIPKKALTKQDVAIFSEPEGILLEYWKQILNDYDSTIILNIGMNLREPLFGRKMATHLENDVISNWMSETLDQKKYNVDVYRSRFSSEQVIFICSKSPIGII